MNRDSFTPQEFPEAPEPEPEKKRFPRRLIRILGLAAMVFVMIYGNQIRSYRAREQQRRMEQVESTLQAETTEAVPEDLFFGRIQMKNHASAVDASQGLFMRQSVEGTTLELAYLPLSLEARPEMPGIMVLEFQDADGEVYRFEASYTLSGGSLLILDAPEDADYAQTETEYEVVAPLTDTLRYHVHLERGDILLRPQNVQVWGVYQNQE